MAKKAMISSSTSVQRFDEEFDTWFSGLDGSNETKSAQIDNIREYMAGDHKLLTPEWIALKLIDLNNSRIWHVERVIRAAYNRKELEIEMFQEAIFRNRSRCISDLIGCFSYGRLVNISSASVLIAWFITLRRTLSELVSHSYGLSVEKNSKLLRKQFRIRAGKFDLSILSGNNRLFKNQATQNWEPLTTDLLDSWITKIEREFDNLYFELDIKDEEGRSTAPQELSDESKLDKAKLAPTFEGQLDRQAMAQALAAVMKEQGLSVRKAAGEADVSASVISQIKSQEASIDQAAKVLNALGFEIDLTVRPKDHS